MTTGLASGVANSLLDALGNASNYTAPTAFWVKLHLGDPGAAGATSPAVETTRKQTSFGAAAAGSMVSDADTAWTNVSTTETYSHVSYWSASTAGTFLGSSALSSSRSVVAGDDFTIPSGSLTLSFSPVAA